MILVFLELQEYLHVFYFVGRTKLINDSYKFLQLGQSSGRPIIPCRSESWNWKLEIEHIEI